MTDHAAYCFYKVFAPEAPKAIQFDRHYLLYAAKGVMRLEAEGKSWVLPPSRAAWLAADTPIKMSFSKPVTCCSVLYKLDDIPAPNAACTVFEMTPLSREMILGCRAWGPGKDAHEALAGPMFKALAALCRKLAEQPCNTWIPTGRSESYQRAIAHTFAHLDAELSLNEVATAACVSERTMARRFAEEAGMSWRQVQRKMRMIRAMELLAEEAMPVTEVALAVGYGSQSAFNAAFKAFTGQSPTAYRRGT